MFGEEHSVSSIFVRVVCLCFKFKVVFARVNSIIRNVVSGLEIHMGTLNNVLEFLETFYHLCI